MPYQTVYKKPVATVGQNFGRFVNVNPVRAVICLADFPAWSRWAAQINMADLARPQVIIRHICISLKRPEAPINADRPAGFLADLAVQRHNRGFAGINAAAGQLKLGLGRGLKGNQNLAPAL